jgi:uncharacterized protein YciI
MIRTRLLPILFMAGSLIAADEKDAPKAEPQFQMSTYVLGFLRKGPNWGQGSKEESARIQEGHMANTRKMASTGKLLVAGPMGDDTDLRGIFIFKAKSPDEVRAMADEDPAVKSGRLVLELHPWFAAAGLRVNDPIAPPATPTK